MIGSRSSIQRRTPLLKTGLGTSAAMVDVPSRGRAVRRGAAVGCPASLADSDAGVGHERVLRHRQVDGRRALADPASRVVVRAMARAEVTVEIALRLAGL